MVRTRVRIRFTKQRDLRWIGHLDLLRCLERLLRRAGMPLAFSEGFHPKPQMTVPAALALGIASADELAEFELREPLAAEEILARLRACEIPGLSIVAAEVLAENRKGRLRSASYEAAIPPPHGEGLLERIAALLASAECLVPRDRGRPPVDLRPLVEEMQFDGQTLRMRLRIDQRLSASPRDVLRALELPDLEAEGVCLWRTHLEVAA